MSGLYIVVTFYFTWGLPTGLATLQGTQDGILWAYRIRQKSGPGGIQMEAGSIWQPPQKK